MPGTFTQIIRWEGGLGFQISESEIQVPAQSLPTYVVLLTFFSLFQLESE